jgi:hypothetical protein
MTHSEDLFSLRSCRVSFDALKEIRCFYKKKEIRGLRGFCLVMSGHSPYDGLEFSMEKFLQWGKDNYIDIELDEYNRVAILNHKTNAYILRKIKPKNQADLLL